MAAIPASEWFAQFLDDAKRAKGEITNSVEFARIKALPRRAIDLDSVPNVTPLFRKEGGTMSFRPIQSLALIEAARADGLFAPISVGEGKTLITLTLPRALDSKKTVLLVPPRLKKQLAVESKKYAEHFDLPLDRIQVISYSELSSAKKENILEESGADLIVCDEAANLRRRSSARTKRFMRFARNNPECRFVFLSGTMTTRSILDYAHLIELALRKNSPLPVGYRELQDWAGAIDVNPPYFMLPGVLLEFCEEDEEARDGYRRRMIDTQGVVATSKNQLGTSLLVRRRTLAVPVEVQLRLDEVRKKWSLEDEEFDSPLTKARALRQLACGFFYRWVWPSGEKDHDWLEARAEWHREVREKLKQSRKGLDSPLLLSQAAERYFQGKREGVVWNSEHWSRWREEKEKRWLWSNGRLKSTPPTETIWVDDYVIQAAMRWARTDKEPCIVWYEHRAVGEALAQASAMPHYGAGTDSSQSKDHAIICSIKAQGTGMNLQHYSRNFITSLPPNGALFEQVAGRTHRMGQEADEVWIDWLGHTIETEDSFASVVSDAEYIQRTFGQPQKALYASCLMEGEPL